MFLKMEAKIQKNWKATGAMVQLQMTDFKLQTLNGSGASFMAAVSTTVWKDIVDSICADDDKKVAEVQAQQVVIDEDVAMACKRRRKNAPTVASKATPKVT